MIEKAIEMALTENPQKNGNRLREHRKAAGMTLDELAIAVGSRKAYMWQLENKDSPDVGIKLAFRLSKALGKPIEAIFDLT